MQYPGGQTGNLQEEKVGGEGFVVGAVSKREGEKTVVSRARTGRQKFSKVSHKGQLRQRDHLKPFQYFIG